MSKERDNGVKVGDIITAYHKGYHLVVDIQPRSRAETNGTGLSTIIYRTIVDSHLKPCKNITRPCSAYWCKVITKEQIEQERSIQVAHYNEGYDTILKYFN